MENLYKIIGNSKLFAGIEENELISLLKCLDANVKEYSKDDFIFHAGESLSNVGLVLSGSVHIINEDFWGNRIIISQVNHGFIFGESYAFSGSPITSVSAVVNENSKIMHLDVKRVITTCSSSCIFHAKLIRNLMTILAEKNSMLINKIQHTSKRTTREKLLSYFSDESKKSESSSFVIPFNRQQLSDYLCVDRSAMSFELSKMRSEGLLEYKKNHIILKKGANDYL